MANLSETRKLTARVNRYIKAIHQLMEGYNYQAAAMVEFLGIDVDSDTPFTWKANPVAEKAMDEIQEQMTADLFTLIENGVKVEWGNSNSLVDKMVNQVLQRTGTGDGKTGHFVRDFKSYYSTNDDALNAFIKRKKNGMNLSQRCWTLSEEYKQGLEAAIACGVKQGTSAVNLSKRISKYLVDYPSLQKDYKQMYGKAINIGDCEYRAARLARTEINMSYRRAEQERWRELWFVVGYEIHTSGTHGVSDMCDKLSGKYPKDFNWDGWHPNCKCFATPIMMTREEMDAWDGEGEPPTDSVNSVTDVPEGMKTWVKENGERIANSKSTPTFITQNKALMQLVQDENFQYNVYIALKDAGVEDMAEFAKNNPSLTRIALTLSEKNITETSGFFGYVPEKYEDRSDKIKVLYEEFFRLRADNSQKAMVERIKIINQIKSECASIRYADLDAIYGLSGKGFKFAGCASKEIQAELGKIIAGDGTEVFVRGMRIDSVKIIAPNGKTLMYDLDGDLAEMTSPLIASSQIDRLPSLLQGNFNGIIFTERKHPIDVYYQHTYKNFSHGGAYGGEPISFHYKCNEKQFAETISHEIAHHIDNRKHLSSMSEYADAIIKDNKWPSSYAKNSAKEDIAELVAEMNRNQGKEELEDYLLHYYPNRYAFLMKHMPELIKCFLP